ncbi:unnamed protein product [Rotaria sp. Silwood2]|nr:unnamed protein product [Rotaria sp. Silwood2]
MNILFGRQSQYNALITPIYNASEPLDVYFGLALAQIINVYEKEQIVKVNVWLQLRWYDYQMKWNPDRFGRLDSIRVPPEQVWTPDLVLFNNGDGNYEASYKSNTVISSDGHIQWIPPAIYKLTCTINVEYFPFDEQKCELRFGTSGRSASQVRFGWYATANSMELSDYVPSGIWTLIDAPAEIRTIQSPDPPYESRSEMVFFMIIRRKSLFYTINLILPTMMISLLSITLFCLPSDAAEKMMLCTSILVSLLFFKNKKYMMTTTTLLDKPLDDLCREITDLRQIKILRDYNMNKLCSIITVSRDSLKETEKFQQQILKQLQQFEISLADINDILRANSEQKIELEQQQQSGDDVDIRAKLMALNAEALECRAASVQLQLEARMVLSKATEIEKRANDELAQQALEMKIKQQEIERNRAEEYERRARLEEERQRLKELQQKQQEQERLLAMTKNHSHEDEYAHWSVREFMNDNQYPPCIIRTSSNASSMPINVKYLTVPETENLLDSQEELISTPINIKFDLTTNDQKFIILAIPFIFKRSSHRENVIKIRQSNVSRLKHDTILIQKQLSGRYVSNADPRFTLHWPKDVSQNDFSIDICVQPVDLPTFAQFSQHFSHECQGLLAVGPIIELNFDEINLLKPIQFTLPILIQPKKKPIPPKTIPTTNDESNILPQPTISQPSQQEMIAQQQQLIFKSMLGEDLSNERLVLLYSGSNDNTWHIDTDIQLIDSKTHDIITTDIQYLHSRIIVARCDKQLMSLKQLPTTICLLEQTLNQRSATLFLRRRLTNPNEICLVCCSGQRADIVENEIQQENYSTENEQVKEIILEEGQILELRFRGNIIPKNNDQQSVQFAFNTYFPFYFETNVSEIDKYSQHLSSYFYGFIQIFSKQKFLRNAMKEIDKKKQQSDIK